MEGFLILFNRREAANGFVEAVIVLIVIHQGHLSHQDAILRPPELVIETRRKRDAFPGGQPHHVPRLHLALDAVEAGDDGGVRQSLFVRGVVQLDVQLPPPRLMMSSTLFQWKCMGVTWSTPTIISFSQ